MSLLALTKDEINEVIELAKARADCLPPEFFKDSENALMLADPHTDDLEKGLAKTKVLTQRVKQLSPWARVELQALAMAGREPEYDFVEILSFFRACELTGFVHQILLDCHLHLHLAAGQELLSRNVEVLGMGLSGGSAVPH